MKDIRGGAGCAESRRRTRRRSGLGCSGNARGVGIRGYEAHRGLAWSLLLQRKCNSYANQIRAPCSAGHSQIERLAISDPYSYIGKCILKYRSPASGDKLEAVTTSTWHSNGTAISPSPAATAPSSWYICFALLSAQLRLPTPLTLSPGAGDQVGPHWQGAL